MKSHSPAKNQSIDQSKILTSQQGNEWKQKIVAFFPVSPVDVLLSWHLSTFRVVASRSPYAIFTSIHPASGCALRKVQANKFTLLWPEIKVSSLCLRECHLNRKYFLIQRNESLMKEFQYSWQVVIEKKDIWGQRKVFGCLWNYVTFNTPLINTLMPLRYLIKMDPKINRW